MSRLSRIIAALFILAAVSGCESAVSVEVHAPVDEVWAYVADSRNAQEWSVFFDHISPLPGAQDGKVGALRRCFRRADERGVTWDELTVSVEPGKERQLRTFAIQGFGMDLLNHAEFDVFQRFSALKNGNTRLTFASRLAKPHGLRAALRFLDQKEEGERIIRLNLENIAAAVEAHFHGSPYRRPHPYEPTQIWE